MQKRLQWKARKVIGEARRQLDEDLECKARCGFLAAFKGKNLHLPHHKYIIGSGQMFLKNSVSSVRHTPGKSAELSSKSRIT